MKKIGLMLILTGAFVSCEQQNKPNHTKDYDNTERNVRDRDMHTPTPGDQSESEADRTITQKIRQALVSDEMLSTNAKNIKVITINRVVTLRGPILNLQEKDAIARKINSIPGIEKVDNQLEITKDKL